MIYLDNGATSFPKPVQVREAMVHAMRCCTNPGRGGHPTAMAAAEQVYACREQAAKLFDCRPEQVVFTANCTQGLNMAIRTLIKPGDAVVISGFEHNAVTRPLRALQAQVEVAGRRLFDWADTLEAWEKALKKRPKAAVFTHVSNVFGYILPIQEMAAMCQRQGIPFIVDAAQSAGMLPVSLKALGADFIAMPGHKGLLGPQGTGLLLCGRMPEPLLFGGTGSMSLEQTMPDFLPDRGEAGTLNVPGIAGLGAGMVYIQQSGMKNMAARQQEQAAFAAKKLYKMGMQVFAGPHQSGTVSFVPNMDCQHLAALLAERGVAVRAGLHCAPLAHESAGTVQTGTVRLSFGHNANRKETEAFLRIISQASQKI